MPLRAWTLQINDSIERSRLSHALRESPDHSVLVLDTCQRFECFGASLPECAASYVVAHRDRQEAFERLARIAAGLESRILGELEILGQVRTAYKSFKSGDFTVRELDAVFQKAVSLGRRARRLSGIDRKLTSLSGIAAREMLNAVPVGEPIAVIGSGSIASSAARYLYKRGSSPLRIFSRCPERAADLALKLNSFGCGLDALDADLKGVHGILCATAAPHPVLYAQHLDPDDPPTAIVDLGEPPDCHESAQSLDGVEYLDLLAIEQRANVNSAYRTECAVRASQIVRDGASAWAERN